MFYQSTHSRLFAFRLEVSALILLLVVGGITCISTAQEPNESTGQDATQDEMNDRIDELENQVMELEERVGDRAVVHAFDAIKLDLGGYLTQTFTTVWSEDTTRSSFDSAHFQFFIKAEISDRWSTFTLLEFAREAEMEGVEFGETSNSDIRFHEFENEVKLELYEIRYSHSDALNIKVGQFVTQHGITNIQHFDPLLLHVQRPMMIRHGFETFFQEATIGGQVDGQFNMGEGDESVLSYVAYLGSNDEDGNNFTWGGRAAYAFGDSGITVGANYGGLESDIRFVGADLLIESGKLQWKSEVFTTVDKPSGTDDRTGFYTQPAWNFTDKLIGFYRYDYLDPGSLDIGSRSEHVVGMNYLFSPTVRARAAVTFAKFNGTGDDAEFLQLSLTISF